MEKNNSEINTPIIDVLLISSAVSFFIYSLFFHFSEQIWNYYEHINPMELTASIRLWMDPHDGIEAYVLYLSALIGMGLSSYLINRNKHSPWSLPVSPIITTALPKSSDVGMNSRKMLNSFLFNMRVWKSLACLIAAMLFFKSLGFYPPMPAIATGWRLVFTNVLVFGFLLILKKVTNLSKAVADRIVMLILLPICFISTREISLIDYSFILSPAYRLLHHVKLGNIYLQYDLLMSLFAFIWMKLGLAINDFQIIPRISTYLFLVGIYLYTRRMFTKSMAYLLLVSIIVIKIYAVPNIDLAVSIQHTPLRLDLWLILLFIAAERGIYSKLVGFTLGLMLFVHHNFGQFYFMSYMEVLFVLFLLDYKDTAISQKQSLFFILKKHVLLILPNLIFIMIGMLSYYITFKHFFSEGMLLYKDLGIGFLRVCDTSFYWYALVLLCSVFALLILKRKILSYNYFTSGLFLLFLALGNSLYFLGRSHEWNMLSISGSFILTLFLLFDLLKRIYLNPLKTDMNVIQSKNFATYFIEIAPIIFILIATYYYSERISQNITTQASNILHGQMEYPMSLQALRVSDGGKEQFEKKLFNINALKSVTNNSRKVFVLSYLYDFYYYYYGQYKPRGHFFPYYAWPLKSSLFNYLQKLLDKGFYLVIPQGKIIASNEELQEWEIEGHKEELESLRYSHDIEKDGFRVIWK